MRRAVGLVIVLAVSTTAFAHRDSGTYTLQRAQRSRADADKVPLPACVPDAPTPETLIIKYAGPDAPAVIVNGEEWRREGLTTEQDGQVSERPMRVATKPDPPKDENVMVWFRRDSDVAIAQLTVLRLDAKTKRAACATAFLFKGRYTP